MYRAWVAAASVCACVVTAGCSGAGEQGNAAANGAAEVEGVSGETIAAALDENSQFARAAKAAGLDSTLAGPGPYTVFVPADDAFAKLPDGSLETLMQPESRAELTRVLTYHILPGTVLAEDIGKTIDNADGTAVMMTVGGSTFSATREDGKIVLTDAAGTKATVTATDEKHSNGVVHRIDTVLMPAGDQG